MSVKQAVRKAVAKAGDVLHDEDIKITQRRRWSRVQ